MDKLTLSELLKHAKKPLSVADVSKRTGESEAVIKQLMDECYHEGLAVAVKHGKYAHPDVMRLTLCKARILPGAPAFASPLDGTTDFYMDMPDETAFDGDLVFVRETEGGYRRRGILVYIVKRVRTLLTGTLFLAPPEFETRYRRHSRRPHYVPDDKYFALIPDRRYPEQIPVEGDLNGAINGELCLFRIISWPYKNHEMKVEVAEHLGDANDIGANLSASCALHGIQENFNDDTVAEAALLPTDPTEEDMAGRLDLRDKLICTIDGADAKDFDDAVSLETDEAGRTVLGVHIADVSHYVREGSALDAEARSRGTSVYLPGRTIPMLPEALSNGLCSLQPNVNRLTFSCIMTLSGTQITEYRIVPSVICSKARLTYDGVNNMLDGKPSDVPEALHGMLRQMNALAQKLKHERLLNGSLELELPEPDFRLDSNGYPVEMCVRTRGEAHKLIEEFMLLANKCVAQHACETELPFAFRVHESPDSEKLFGAENILAAMGHAVKLGSKPTQSKLQTVLDSYKDSPRSVIVSTLLLRAMSKARYSEKNLGHYGLAFRYYCHFTSPIRRYPDLLVHRMLREQLCRKFTEEETENLNARMHMLTGEASEHEEQAAQCERECDKIMSAAYLSRNHTKEFTATLVRINKKFVTVMLDSSYEGKIPYRNMDDRYSADEDNVFIIGERHRRTIRLGERVRVTPSAVEISTGETEFWLLPEKKKE